MTSPRFPRVASFKSADALRAHLQRSNIDLAFDAHRASPEETPLARPLDVDGFTVGNRFCILPMEGWDGTRDGKPSELTSRRWRNFGASGAKLMWGGEAAAVRPDGRANPNQLLITSSTQSAVARLRNELIDAHRERFGSNADRDLLIGLQLTHSGRYARPHVWDRPEPMAAYHHPVLDRRFPSGIRVFTDDELDRLVEDFIAAARLAYEAGFQFVDVKQCHGYLGHELLGAQTRTGRYGGGLEKRFTFLRQVIEGIHTAVPKLAIGVRLSIFDTVPYWKTESGIGAPDPRGDARGAGFGVLDRDLDAALSDARQFLQMVERLGVRWICTTAGSPYYNPHVQRPAAFPPLDGYEPPEDPLAGVARQITATARLKSAFPRLVFVGSAYSYLQEWLPHVAQFAVRTGMVDFVGLGRVALSYPDLPADVLSGAPLRRDSLCRTFSDCTTGPRLGLVSGCYPLDAFYGARPEARQVKDARARMRSNEPA